MHEGFAWAGPQTTGFCAWERGWPLSPGHNSLGITEGKDLDWQSRGPLSDERTKKDGLRGQWPKPNQAERIKIPISPGLGGQQGWIAALHTSPAEATAAEMEMHTESKVYGTVCMVVTHIRDGIFSWSQQDMSWRSWLSRFDLHVWAGFCFCKIFIYLTAQGLSCSRQDH